MAADETKALESSVLNLQARFTDLTTKLDTFATTQQTTADQTASRLDVLEKAVQESYDKTQEQLRIGDEMIQNCLTSVGDFNGKVEEAIARLTKAVDEAQETASNRIAAGEQGIIAGEQRLAQTEQKVADALVGITANIEALRGELLLTWQAAATASVSRAVPEMPRQPAAAAGPAWRGDDPWTAGPGNDPWAGPRPAVPTWTGAPGHELLSERDFSGIDKFDSTMSRLADWIGATVWQPRRVAHTRAWTQP